MNLFMTIETWIGHNPGLSLIIVAVIVAVVCLGGKK